MTDIESIPTVFDVCDVVATQYNCELVEDEHMTSMDWYGEVINGDDFQRLKAQGVELQDAVDGLAQILAEKICRNGFYHQKEQPVKAIFHKYNPDDPDYSEWGLELFYNGDTTTYIVEYGGIWSLGWLSLPDDKRQSVLEPIGHMESQIFKWWHNMDIR